MNKIKIFEPKDGIKAKQHRKENHFNSSYAVIAYTDGKFFTPVELRLYATQSTWYACLWMQYNDVYASGSGKASGYGYHKPSAAVEEALHSAGIVLEDSISGHGDYAIEGALRTICRHLGIIEYHIHYSHA